jgi:hypothetical protein
MKLCCAMIMDAIFVWARHRQKIIRAGLCRYAQRWVEREKLVRRKGGEAMTCMAAIQQHPPRPASAIAARRYAPRPSAYLPSALRASTFFGQSSTRTFPTTATPRHLGLAFDHLADPNRPSNANPPPHAAAPKNPSHAPNNTALTYLLTTSTSQNNTIPSEISRVLIRMERSKTDASFLSSIGHPSPGDTSPSLGNASWLPPVPPLPPLPVQWRTPSPIPSAQDSLQASLPASRPSQHAEPEGLLEAVEPDGTGLLARWMTPREKLPESFVALPTKDTAQRSSQWKKLRSLRRRCADGIRHMHSRFTSVSAKPVADWAPMH